MSEPSAVSGGPRLFDEAALEEAARQGSESHFRWLALSADPEAIALRETLQRCYELADSKRQLLRTALMHERWGQHIGALAHLLTLGLLAAQGWRVHNEPGFGRQSPDILATRGDAAQLLVEVRAITGAGSFPWEHRRESGHTLAHDPAKEQLVLDTVAKVLARKAETYRPLVEQLRIPFVICIYEDKDSELSRLARELAFGRAAGGAGRDDGADERDAEGGVFSDRSQFGHVSALIVLRRLDTPDGRLLLAGDLLLNPFAQAPLPDDAFSLLRAYGLDTTRSPPRMHFRSPSPRSFAV